VLVILSKWKYRQDVRVSILSLFKMLIFTFGIVPTVCDFWNCSDSMWLLEQFQKSHTVGTIPKVTYCRNNSKSHILSEQFQKSHTVGQYVTFGIVPTVCDFWNCSDSIWLLELFRQYVTFVFHFITGNILLTLWHKQKR
jgi:hypothetical protein